MQGLASCWPAPLSAKASRTWNRACRITQTHLPVQPINWHYLPMSDGRIRNRDRGVGRFSLRQAFIQTLCDLAAEDERIVLLTGDLGYMVMEPFRRRFPERFFNVGVAEQNMIGMATGLAEAGFRPYAYSIATFAALRAFEFIRNGPVLHRLPVRMVGMGMGFEYGHAGPTHYAVEDIGALRTLPGLDDRRARRFGADRHRVSRHRRLARPDVLFASAKTIILSVHGLDGRFELGRLEIVREGADYGDPVDGLGFGGGCEPPRSGFPRVASRPPWRSFPVSIPTLRRTWLICWHVSLRDYRRSPDHFRRSCRLYIQRHSFRGPLLPAASAGGAQLARRNQRKPAGSLAQARLGPRRHFRDSRECRWTGSPVRVELASVVLPVHNQADHIESVLEEHARALSQLDFPFEIHARGQRSPQEIGRSKSAEISKPDLPVIRTLCIEQGGWGVRGASGLKRSARRPAVLLQLGPH